MRIIISILIAGLIHEAEGNNLLMNKPSKQFSTLQHHSASNANDGDPSTYSFAHFGLSFWQGDLQGYYMIHSISVTSHQSYAGYIQNALIGVSANDVTCPNDEVIKCGQWPDENIGTTFVYTCNHSQPVRFVRVYREDNPDYLNIAEVSAQGTPTNNLKGVTFDRLMSKVVSSISRSLATDGYKECANACFNRQPCISFSFAETAHPNCLLSSDKSTTLNTAWVTYRVNGCSVTWNC